MVLRFYAYQRNDGQVTKYVRNGAHSYLHLLERDVCCSQNREGKHAPDITPFAFAAQTSECSESSNRMVRFSPEGSRTRPQLLAAQYCQHS